MMFRVIYYYPGWNVPQREDFPTEKVAREFISMFKEKNPGAVTMEPYKTGIGSNIVAKKVLP